MIYHGKSTPETRDWVLGELKDILTKAPYPVTVEVKRFYENRSSGQNALLWGVIYLMIAVEMGEDVDSVHEICRERFLSEFIQVNDKEYRICRSTASLTKDEFSAYIEQVKQFAWHELRLVIPEVITDEHMVQAKAKYREVMFLLNIR